MSLYFPLFVDLSEKTVLVVGGGTIAERRARAIRPFAGRMTVVAPEIGEAFEAFLSDAEIRRRAFEEADLDGAALVLTCTDDKALNRRITSLARERGIPANNASDKTDCDFYFPGLVVSDPVVVGITASGEAHALAKSMREKIAAVVDETLSAL